jgi:hypothetical protein
VGYYPKTLVLTVPLSFETSLQAQIDIPFGSRVLLLSAKSTVTKALAGTDAGTVTFKDEADATLLTLTHDASAALETIEEGAFPANTIVERGDHLKLDPAKTTAGGEVTVTVSYQLIGG